MKNLYKNIIPADSIIWWETGVCTMNTEKHLMLFRSDSVPLVNLNEFTEYNTFSSNYFTSFPSLFYLVYKTANGNVRYITKVEQIVTFIDTVNNLSEALFLVYFFGYYAQTGKRFGSYCYNNGEYTFSLCKILNPPDDLTVDEKLVKAKVKVDANGDVYEFTGKKNLKWRKLSVKDLYGH